MATSSRRTFLALTTAATASSVPSRAASEGPYDFAAIDARLARPARHRQVFATARVAGGVVVALMNHGLDAYEETLGQGAGALHAAAVFYSRGVVLGLGDAMWRKYRLADQAQRREDAIGVVAPAGNPFANALAALRRRGASFFVCDNALADWSTYLGSIAGFTATSPDAIHAELRAHLVPSALLVPAGVYALDAAQEAHFTYVQASL